MVLHEVIMKLPHIHTLLFRHYILSVSLFVKPNLFEEEEGYTLCMALENDVQVRLLYL